MWKACKSCVWMTIIVFLGNQHIQAAKRFEKWGCLIDLLNILSFPLVKSVFTIFSRTTQNRRYLHVDHSLLWYYLLFFLSKLFIFLLTTSLSLQHALNLKFKSGCDHDQHSLLRRPPLHWLPMAIGSNKAFTLISCQ